MEGFGNDVVPNESNDVLMVNDADPMDDAFHREESHYRRSSYTGDDSANLDDSREHHHRGSRDDRGRGRSLSPDGRSRDYQNSGSSNRSHHHDRDDKYEGEHRSSHGHERGGRGRSRSKSPGRYGGGSASGSSSLRDRRVYVGNLSYDVKWTNLKDFMRQIGPVAHADVLLNADGRSKGCGVVEYQNADDAREAIRKLNDVVLMGRAVFVREDRESEARIGVSGGRGAAPSHSRDSGNPGASSGTRQVYVANDKFGPPAGGATRGSSRHEPSRGSSSRGEDYGRGSGGGGGGSGGYGGDSYSYGSGGHGDYRHESSSSRSQHDVYDGRSGRHSSNYAAEPGMDVSIPSGPAAGSGDRIYIRNLPFTTTEQDLRDLFKTCGPIRMTEILMDGGRPKGSGIVRFELFESADKAVARFNGYKYGGRPLEIMYDRA
ncbi:hypothetical protein BGZ99_004557 [Dissophora globulifera]|uniref:RRM domain-containing protein n=1 Tax=Dissophora globulifera TaxID=979702 RepID=A0A9P6UUX2_9FUNG|nr:hypothetical protein BGZ99_004557 [Dissophora globulifera]